MNNGVYLPVFSCSLSYIVHKHWSSGVTEKLFSWIYNINPQKAWNSSSNY